MGPVAVEQHAGGIVRIVRIPGKMVAPIDQKYPEVTLPGQTLGKN